MSSSNPIIINALRAASNMSAQQAATLVEMEIGRPDSDAETLLAQYGSPIRSAFGERYYRDLYDRAVSDNASRR